MNQVLGISIEKICLFLSNLVVSLRRAFLIDALIKTSWLGKPPHTSRWVSPRGVTFVLALLWYCRDNIKYGLLSKHLFQRKLQYGSCKNLKVKIHFHKKQWLSLIKCGIKNIHRSKLYLWHAYWKEYFRSCYFWWFVSRFFWNRVKKHLVYFGLCRSSLHLQKSWPNKYCLWEVKLISYM